MSALERPYSPDLNPIEQVFAKLKTLLRKAAERTVEATWQRIGTLLNCFTPQDCANQIRHAGYAATQMENASNPPTADELGRGAPATLRG